MQSVTTISSFTKPTRKTERHQTNLNFLNVKSCFFPHFIICVLNLNQLLECWLTVMMLIVNMSYDFCYKLCGEIVERCKYRYSGQVCVVQKERATSCETLAVVTLITLLYSQDVMLASSISKHSTKKNIFI